MAIKQIEAQEQKTPQYFLLNNELNIVKNNSIQLDKDKEAVYRYFIDYVNPNTVWFGSLREKIDYLVREGYIKKDLIEQYDFEFIKELYQDMEAVKFRFKTFMGAYKFYSQYAMKTKDGKNILERYEDRIIFNALELANGDEELAEAIAYEIIYKRYQPATPTFN